MQRIVQPEILDSLPHDDPQALANRRDLRLINALLRNRQWFARKLFPRLQSGERVVEFGAGEGILGKACARARPELELGYVAVDLAPPPPDWPTGFEWRRVDCMSLPDFTDFNVFLGNMILHQFNDEELRALGKQIAASSLRLIALVEPSRYALHLWQLKAMGPVFCKVSHHDGAVSVRAGFRGDELPKLLGLGDDWRFTTQRTLLGAYRMLAERIP